MTRCDHLASMTLNNFSVAVTAMTTAAIIAASGVHLASSQQDEDDPCKNNPCQNGICLSNGSVFATHLAKSAKKNSFLCKIIYTLQGDHSGRVKPPVDNKTEAPF